MSRAENGLDRTDVDWFKSAVFDKLQWLGVDCLWLPPFFPSLLKDGGYDVADYTAVTSDIATIGDFHEFLDTAHTRGIRVAVDVVLNHTDEPCPVAQMRG